jgi:hypothetical protein
MAHSKVYEEIKFHRKNRKYSCLKHFLGILIQYMTYKVFLCLSILARIYVGVERLFRTF